MFWEMWFLVWKSILICRKEGGTKSISVGLECWGVQDTISFWFSSHIPKLMPIGREVIPSFSSIPIFQFYLVLRQLASLGEKKKVENLILIISSFCQTKSYEVQITKDQIRNLSKSGSVSHEVFHLVNCWHNNGRTAKLKWVFCHSRSLGFELSIRFPSSVSTQSTCKKIFTSFGASGSIKSA